MYDVSCLSVCLSGEFLLVSKFHGMYPFKQLEILKTVSKSDFTPETVTVKAKCYYVDPWGSPVWIKTEIFAVFRE